MSARDTPDGGFGYVQSDAPRGGQGVEDGCEVLARSGADLENAGVVAGGTRARGRHGSADGVVIPRVEKVAARRDHVGGVAGERRGGSGEQRDVTLARHVEAVAAFAQHRGIVEIHRTVAVRAREKVYDGIEHADSSPVPGTDSSGPRAPRSAGPGLPEEGPISW